MYEHGLFGCAHYEFIECWREFLDTLNVWESKYNKWEGKDNFDIDKRTYNRIVQDINKCEKYHIDHFTYNNII